MAGIRVTCPVCGATLEVGARHEGQEVECGECLQVFVAENRDKPKIKIVITHDIPELKPKPKSPGRRRDEDDDYEHDHRREEYDDDRPSRGGGPVGADGTAVAGLVVGVLALLTACCPLSGIAFGILAMVLGGMSKRYAGPSGSASAATVLGSIAFVISIGLLVWLLGLGGFNRLGK
jgi:hypothetical protein